MNQEKVKKALQEALDKKTLEGWDIAWWVAEMRIDLGNLLNNIDNWIARISDVAIVTGAGEKLQAYLARQDAHGILIARLHKFKKATDNQHQFGIVFIEPLGNETTTFNTFVEEFASRCLEAQERKNNGQRLIDLIETFGQRRTQLLIAHMRQEIDRGGHPNSAILNALYALAYPLRLTHGSHWGKIANEIWVQLKRIPEDQYTDHQRLVYNNWQGKRHDQRKEQLRDMFRKMPTSIIRGL